MTPITHRQFARRTKRRHVYDETEPPPSPRFRPHQRDIIQARLAERGIDMDESMNAFVEHVKEHGPPDALIEALAAL